MSTLDNPEQMSEEVRVAYWKQFVEEQMTSKYSAKEFSQLKNLNYDSLLYYRKKFHPKLFGNAKKKKRPIPLKETPSFVPMKIIGDKKNSEALSSSVQIEIEAKKINLNLSGNISNDLLEAILKLMEKSHVYLAQ